MKLSTKQPTNLPRKRHLPVALATFQTRSLTGACLLLFMSLGFQPHAMAAEGTEARATPDVSAAAAPEDVAATPKDVAATPKDAAAAPKDAAAAPEDAAAATKDAAAATKAAAAHQNARALFRQGQIAFRGGNAHGAISLYEQAEAAGFSDPVLLYNLGVANYRAGRLEAARDAFLTASSAPDLAALSFYNLGLVARKAGDDRDASSWFNQTRYHPRASERLRALAHKAQASLTRTSSRKRPVVYASLEGPKLSDHLRVSVNSGFASDSNVYRTPSDPYVDLSDATAPTVTPDVQSGTYIPVEADAELRWGIHEDSYFAVRYGLDGRFYSGAEFSNANELEHEFSLGGAVNRKTKRGGVRWRSHFIVRSSNEQAYDRNDGQDQFVGLDDVSDRFSHTRFGPKAYYHRDIGRFGFGFRVDASITRYEETLDYLDLTHEQYLGGVHISLKPLKRTLVQISGDYYQRLYADRAAKTIDGIRFVTNDNLEYTYQNMGLTVRQQLLRNLVLGLDYRYTQREDVFENYEDYDRHTGRAYLRFRKGRFSARAAFTYRTYDFPNAFAFDEITAGERTLDTTFGQFEAEFRVSRRFAIKAEAILNVVESSDPRSEYDRNRLSAGLTWRM